MISGFFFPSLLFLESWTHWTLSHVYCVGRPEFLILVSLEKSRQENAYKSGRTLKLYNFLLCPKSCIYKKDFLNSEKSGGDTEN